MGGLEYPPARPCLPVANLHLQCLPLRADENSAKAAHAMVQFWAATYDSLVSAGSSDALKPVGRQCHAHTTLMPYAALDENFATATYLAVCPKCDFEQPRSRVVYLPDPDAVWPPVSVSECSSCKAKVKLNTNVLRPPSAISTSGETMGKAADGSIASLLTRFGHNYVLVFAPVNVAREHFMAYVRLGNNWFKYNPGANEETRKLEPQSFTNPPAPLTPSADPLGELLYVRQDVLQVTAHRLEPLLSGHPQAGQPLPVHTRGTPRPLVHVSKGPAAPVTTKKSSAVSPSKGPAAPVTTKKSSAVSPSKGPAAPVTSRKAPAAKSVRKTIRKRSFDVRKLGKNFPLPDDFEDEHTERVRIKNAALDRLRNEGKM